MKEKHKPISLFRNSYSFISSHAIELFCILFILMHYRFPFIVYFLFIPLWIYIYNHKKINLALFSIYFTITVLISYIQFEGYGPKYLAIVVVVHLLTYIPFIVLSKKYLESKLNFLIIPSIYYIIAMLLSFTIVENFWFVYAAFLPLYPLLIPYFGSLIITFLLISFQVILFNCLVLKRKSLLQYSFLVFFFIVFFITTTQTFSKEYSDRETIKVAAIQTHHNQEWFVRYENKDQNLRKYLSLSQNALDENAQIIVWPEYAFTHELEFDYEILDELQLFSNNNNVSLLVGGVKLVNYTKDFSHRYNAIYTFTPNENIQLYLAYEPLTLFDNVVVKAQSNPLFNHNSIPYFVSLCYEENFPHIYSDAIQFEEPEFLIINGNQYHVKTYSGLQVLSLPAHLRAVETNRFIVRLESSGITKIIDPNGATLEELEAFKEGVLVYDVPRIQEKTFYSIKGKYLEYFLLFFCFLFFCLEHRRKK